MGRLGDVRLQGLGGPSLKNVLVELLGLRLRLGPQLPLQRGDAYLVLFERGAAPSLARIEPHQRPMHDLLRGVHREQPHGGLDPPLCLSCLRLMREPAPEALQRPPAQPLSLPRWPLREPPS